MTWQDGTSSAPDSARGDAGPVQDAADPAPPLLDLALGLAAVVCGVAIFVYAGGFRPTIPNTLIGPALMMQVCGVVFALCGAGMMSAAGRRRSRPVSRTGGVRMPLREQLGEHRFAPVPVILLIAVLAATPWLGFLVAAGLATLLFVRAGGASWIGATVTATILCCAVWLAFGQVMRVPLPQGAWF